MFHGVYYYHDFFADRKTISDGSYSEEMQLYENKYVWRHELNADVEIIYDVKKESFAMRNNGAANELMQIHDSTQVYFAGRAGPIGGEVYCFFQGNYTGLNIKHHKEVVIFYSFSNFYF
jgi:hypothetical protein